MDEQFYQDCFMSPYEFKALQSLGQEGPNGWLLFVSCNSAIDFTQEVRSFYQNVIASKGVTDIEIPLLGTHEKPITRVFSDSETNPRLAKHVAGSDAYVFQCAHERISGNTVNENIQQLLQVVRTLRSHRANTITVINPYSPYSRQDKPTYMKRESALAKLFADQLKVAGADIYLTYHPHTLGLYGFYEPEIKFVALSGLDLFLDIFRDKKGKKNVVAISTDSGAAKFTVHFSDAMNIPYAIANKYRSEGEKTSLLGIIGDLEGKDIGIITDDETVTGGSILNAVEALYTQYNLKEIHVALSHIKVKQEHLERFIRAHEEFGLKELHVTDSIPQNPDFLKLDFVKVHSLAGMFATTINRLHYNHSVSKVFLRS